jgi:hypothetical protein
VEAVVVDAQTGEPLPYASVIAAGGEGTVTNHEGRFFLDTEGNERVTVTYVGYEKAVVAAGRIGHRIALKPFARQLSGVEVKGEKGFLSRIARHCEKSLRRNSDMRSNFFYRELTRNNGRNCELTEAFFDGECAYGLRNLKLVNGRSCTLAPQQYGRTTIINFHLSMQVMPVAKQFKSLGYSVPLVKDAPDRYLDRYDVSYDRLVGQDSSEVYLLHFKAREWVASSIVEGNLYVDGKTLDLLRLDGKVKGAFLTTRMTDGSIVERRQDMGLTVSYTTRQGFSEVEAAATVVQSTGPDGTVTVCRAMMFNMGKKHFKGKKRLREQGDLKKTIEQQGTDSLFWEKNEIVKRTLDEERAIKSLAAMGIERPESAGEMAGSKPLKAHQDLLDLAANVQAFNTYYPQEDIYIQTDHDGYKPGETMWLSARVQRSDSHQPSNLSQVIHLELLDGQGKKVISKRYALADGYLDTGIPLPKELKDGIYTLRAYTLYQLNWGGSDVYERRIAISREPKPGIEAWTRAATPETSGTNVGDSIGDDSLLLVLTHSGNVVERRVATRDSLRPLVRQWTGGQSLQSGYNRVAALDADGELKFDSIVYCEPAWQRPEWEVTSPKGELEPFCKVRLRLKAAPKTSYLLCVTDAAQDFGPQQQSYHQWIVERTLRHADGTLRHDLKTMSGRNPFQRTCPPETDEYVRGRLLDTQGQPVGNVKLTVRTPGYEQVVKTTPQGLFAVNVRNLGVAGTPVPVSLWVANSKQRKKTFIQLFHSQQFRPDTTVIDCSRELDILIERGRRAGDDGKKRPALDIPLLSEWLTSHDDGFTLSAELSYGSNMPQQRLAYRNRPVIWVVDGKVVAEPPMMNEALTMRIQKDNVDVTRYQLSPEMNAHRPVVVSVETIRPWWKAQEGTRHLLYPTLARQFNFRFPLYGSDHPEHDTRRTLYWNPIVNTDEQGIAEVEFYNNESCTQLNVRVE